MNDRILLLGFPLIPLFMMGLIVAARYALRWDLSRPALVVSHLLQVAVGLRLILRFYERPDALTVALTPWDYSIVFQFDRFKAYFMAAYLTPLLFSCFRLRQLDRLPLRVLFLFYLSGCSGLIVTGDVFNFFVFYELMIMAAYVLIATHRRFYASVKYMIFGAISSALFLAGIIALYASGAYFEFAALAGVARTSAPHFTWMVLLFSLAFLVKGAFFPVSAWVPTCHVAAVTLVSAFLASFTIFSGIYGLLYLVWLPAAAAPASAVGLFLRWISLGTLVAPSLFVFFEPDLKRCVAGSTIYTIGFIGLLLSHRLYEAALGYMVIHAVYKSLMFYLLDDLEWGGRFVAGRLPVLAAGGVCVLFAAGLFPSLVFFLKSPLLDQNPLYLPITLVSAFLLSAGFFKFRWRVLSGWGRAGLPILATLVLAGYYVLFSFVRRPGVAAVGLDLALLAVVLWFAPRLYRRLEPWAGLDRRWVFPNLNVEIFYTLTLVAAGVLALLGPVTR